MRQYMLAVHSVDGAPARDLDERVEADDGIAE